MDNYRELTGQQMDAIEVFHLLINVMAKLTMCIEGRGEQVIKLLVERNVEPEFAYAAKAFVENMMEIDDDQDAVYRKWVNSPPDGRKRQSRYRKLHEARARTLISLAEECRGGSGPIHELITVAGTMPSDETNICPECKRYIPFRDKEGLWDCHHCGIWFNEEGAKPREGDPDGPQ